MPDFDSRKGLKSEFKIQNLSSLSRSKRIRLSETTLNGLFSFYLHLEVKSWRRLWLLPPPPTNRKHFPRRGREREILKASADLLPSTLPEALICLAFDDGLLLLLLPLANNAIMTRKPATDDSG